MIIAFTTAGGNSNHSESAIPGADPVREPGSERPIDVSAVFDTQNDDLVGVVAHSVEHPIRAAPCGPDPGQFVAKRIADTSWLRHQGRGNKVGSRQPPPVRQAAQSAPVEQAG